jgi:hypothetical protein
MLSDIMGVVIALCLLTFAVCIAVATVHGVRTHRAEMEIHRLTMARIREASRERKAKSERGFE